MDLKQLKHLYPAGDASELLPWVWATYQQNTLLFQNDGHWINCAANSWPQSSFYDFLKSYSLLRGPKGSLFANKEDPTKQQARRQFIRICDKHYGSFRIDSKLPWADQVHDAWVKADQDLMRFAQNLRSETFKPSPNMFMPSATLKAFWFYRPNDVPMYDRLAREGLANVSGKKIDPTSFLREFDCVYQENKKLIQEAKSYCTFPYPYDIRIVDKYLWLEGSGAKDDILQRFLAAIDILAD